MIIDCDNYIGVWAQVLYSDDYNFSKKEKNKITAIKSIIEKGYIDDYNKGIIFSIKSRYRL